MVPMVVIIVKLFINRLTIQYCIGKELRVNYLKLVCLDYAGHVGSPRDQTRV
jgi:hypothetical protein